MHALLLLLDGSLLVQQGPTPAGTPHITKAGVSSMLIRVWHDAQETAILKAWTAAVVPWYLIAAYHGAKLPKLNFSNIHRLCLQLA